MLWKVLEALGVFERYGRLLEGFRDGIRMFRRGIGGLVRGPGSISEAKILIGAIQTETEENHCFCKFFGQFGEVWRHLRVFLKLFLEC